MKIGILTFHRAHNYGALLQAYALKTYLESQGHSVGFVDYMPTWHSDVYRLWDNTAFKKKSLKNKFKHIVLWLLTCSRKAERYRNFQRFISQYLQLPANAQYTQSPIQLQEKYDYIVVGSDQIWRNWITSSQYIGFDSVYYGEGITPKPKYVAYAASMGIINYNEKEKLFLERALSNFEKIAVREISLKNELQTLGYDSKLVADPTFLLSKEQWNSLLPSWRYKKEKYVLFYHLIGSTKAKLLAERIAGHLGCKLLTIMASVPKFSNSNEIQTAGPLEFLHSIRDAEFVVATSFHGTAFSVIFQKPFYTLGLGKNSGRVVSLLERIDMSERYLAENEIDGFSYPDFYTNKSENYIAESKAYINCFLR